VSVCEVWVARCTVAAAKPAKTKRDWRGGQGRNEGTSALCCTSPGEFPTIAAIDPVRAASLHGGARERASAPSRPQSCPVVRVRPRSVSSSAHPAAHLVQQGRPTPRSTAPLTVHRSRRRPPRPSLFSSFFPLSPPHARVQPPVGHVARVSPAGPAAPLSEWDALQLRPAALATTGSAFFRSIAQWPSLPGLVRARCEGEPGSWRSALPIALTKTPQPMQPSITATHGLARWLWRPRPQVSVSAPACRAAGLARWLPSWRPFRHSPAHGSLPSSAVAVAR
jgi:hypothetical protein